MPENRLAKARRSLPIGYQFGANTLVEHLHRFNAISGYCMNGDCKLQYCPHLLPYFEHGGRIGEKPPAWMTDERQRFVTQLGPKDTVEEYRAPRVGL